MAETPHIRVADRDDAGALATLAERTFRDTFTADNTPDDMEAYVRDAFSVDRTREELADRSNTFLLAFVENIEAPIGYAKLRDGEPDPSVDGSQPIELERLYVDATAIGHGVGATLMRACLDHAAAAGFQTLWLGVWEQNPRAITFYERWHFHTVGAHVFRLGSDDQNDLIMQRPIEIA